MLKECAKVIDKIPMPDRWVAGIDATPGREMTLGSRQWWEDHLPWLVMNKTKLKLSATNWKKQEEALKKDVPVPEDEGNDDWDFVCRFKPRREGDDSDEEDEEDGDEEDEEDDEEGEAERDKPSNKEKDEKQPHMKLASLHPDWPWVSTVLGLDREQWWTQETLKRDQDDFNMHIYNDFSNFGVIEVMENIFQRFSDVTKPKTASYRDIWPEVEGLVLFLRSSLVDFGMCEDGERISKIIEMVGLLVLTAITVLQKQDVFKPRSDVRNIGIMLAMLIRWAWDEHTDTEIDEEHISWIYKLIDLAEEAQIDLAVPSDFGEQLSEIKAARGEKALQMDRWDSINWTASVKSYANDHAGRDGPRAKPQFGGQHHDITLMSAQERKQYNLG